MNRKEQFLLAKILISLLSKILVIVTYGAYRSPIRDEFADTENETKLIQILFSGEEQENK